MIADICTPSRGHSPGCGRRLPLVLFPAAESERDAWTLIAWMEGTAFYALAGAGTAAAPPLDVLREQLARLLADLDGGDRGGDDAGAA